MLRDIREFAVLGIASPESGGMSDLEAAPNPVEPIEVIDSPRTAATVAGVRPTTG